MRVAVHDADGSTPPYSLTCRRLTFLRATGSRIAAMFTPGDPLALTPRESDGVYVLPRGAAAWPHVAAYLRGVACESAPVVPAAFKKWSGLRTPRSSKKIWLSS